MKDIIYIRPLEPDDARISFIWRNKPELWKYTRFNPTVPITFETELHWVLDVIERKDQYRFAICVSETQEYIGNIQLVNVTESEAELHLFIGDVNWWGKGVGKLATGQLLDYAVFNLDLKKITLEVHVDNLPAISIYEKHGFISRKIDPPFALMELTQLNIKRLNQYEENHRTLAER